MNNMDKEYIIKRLDEERLKDLEKLHEAVYNKKPAPGYFLKKYNTAYTGVTYVGYIAYSNENIAIAYYGVLPCFIEYNDQLTLAAQSADTMTHPGYRFKGMFLMLSNKCFELCKQNNIKLLFGFPNQNSHHGAIKLGWKMTEMMDLFVIKLSGFPFKKFTSKTAFTSNLYNKYVKFVLKKYALPGKDFNSSILKNGYAGIFRDNNYLQYKSYNPTLVIQVEKAKAWIKITSNLVVGDIDCCDTKFDEFLSSLKKIAAKLGVQEIQFHTCPGTKLHQLFSVKYNAIPSFPVLFQDFGTDIPLQQIKFTFADIDIF